MNRWGLGELSITNINTISSVMSQQYFQKSLLLEFWVMQNLLPDFEPYKQKIPEFVVKLYHILQRKQYSDYLTWHGDSQILIKNPKKLQQKVLSHFFRHRRLSSFIRQLNMYRFSKVVKLVKEKNYMYFKNEHFKKGQIKDLLNIKRNNKKSKKENISLETISDQLKDDEISIDQQLNNNIGLNDYRHYVAAKVREISELLKKVRENHPQLGEELAEPMQRCSELMENRSQISQNSFLNLDESRNGTENMLVTMKFLPGMEQMMYPFDKDL